ncbi:MAG: hypothetical protein IJL87_00770 [Clostridia bacterium]|nr:hypothetical protein [Clostridia bacterium]
MKKFFALIISAVMIISLSACGADKTDTTSDLPAESQIEIADSPAELLALAGLSEQQVKTADITAVALTNGDSMGGSINVTAQSPSLDSFNAWYKQLYEACKAVAEGGTVYTGLGRSYGKAFVFAPAASNDFFGQFDYIYAGKEVLVTVTNACENGDYSVSFVFE